MRRSVKEESERKATRIGGKCASAGEIRAEDGARFSSEVEEHEEYLHKEKEHEEEGENTRGRGRGRYKTWLKGIFT